MSTALNDAVQRAINAGVTFAVAAGNNSADACSFSPSSTSAAITVAASDNSDIQASYSNYGSCVDVYAPGTNVYSTWNTDDNAMGTASGTSMATPHVAGAAALYLQAHPSASPAEVSAAIVSSATTGAIAGLGAGSPNRLLHVNGSGGTIILPPPTEPPPTQPPPTEPPPPPPPTNSAPTASFSVSCQKGNCSFNGSNSSDDKAVTSYAWTFGDGTSSVTATSAMASHSYTKKGNYSVTVSLTVSDAEGMKSTVQRSLSIKNNGK
jgi:subtilisin family serine protease